MTALPLIDDIDDWGKGSEENFTRISGCFCPNCREDAAETTLLPTSIPMFREIIVMNLYCGGCGFRNAEVIFGGEIQEKGQRITLTVTSLQDLNRQIVKSDAATLTIPSLELEIPPMTQRGSISTLEGMITTAANNLEAQQSERLRLGSVDNFRRCHEVIQGLRRMVGRGTERPEDEKCVFPYRIILDDPSGNSFVENPNAPSSDPQMTFEKYYRIPSQDLALGLQPSQQALDDGNVDDSNPAHKSTSNSSKGRHTIEHVDELSLLRFKQCTNGTAIGRQEALQFSTTCPHCFKPSATNMCLTDIPHFKEVILMSMLCENCGYKSNEIKGGGVITKLGTKITLKVTNKDDLEREVLKSDTAGVAIPELELELEEGGLDGFYTTVEGLLEKIRDRLEKANPFGVGDSVTKQHTTNDGGDFSEPSPRHVRYLIFLQKLKEMARGTIFPFTVIISDPLSNSFVGPIPRDAIALSRQREREGTNKCYDDFTDSGMVIEEYERTFEQNEILGLNDIKTENYQMCRGEAEVQNTYYGTDKLQELPDRIQHLDVRGPDHPHAVGKAPEKVETTGMGVGSLQSPPREAVVPLSLGLQEKTRYL